MAQVESKQSASSAARAQRVLATLAFALIGVAAIDVIALLVLPAAGVAGSAFDSGGLLIMKVLPLVALPVGLLLMIALFVVVAIRRAREQGSQRSPR
jgi:hypothetical protein